MTATTRTISGKTTMNRMTWFTEITGDRDDCGETEKQNYWDDQDEWGNEITEMTRVTGITDNRDILNKRDDWDEWGGCDEWNE